MISISYFKVIVHCCFILILVRVQLARSIVRSIFLFPPSPPFGGQRGCYCSVFFPSVSSWGRSWVNKASLCAKQGMSQCLL